MLFSWSCPFSFHTDNIIIISMIFGHKKRDHSNFTALDNDDSMEELFQLMEDTLPAQGVQHQQQQYQEDDDDDDDDDRIFSNNHSSDNGMNELAALMDQDDDDDDEIGSQPKRLSTTCSTSNTIRHQKQNISCTAIVTPLSSLSNRPSTTKGDNKVTTTTKLKPVEVSVDDRLGIRMLNRLVSSSDLMDLITNHPYFSPASLSAMSLTSLNTLLLDPARIVDPATVAGKTNLVTVGMVFSNSGTRISSKGGAFCVLTIGNFASGPCVTLFLFGDVYGMYCRTCTPGKVVAVMGPKLLPSSRQDSNNINNKSNRYTDAAISFSIYDRGQLQMVATARDYGTCRGKVRVRGQDGKWSSDGTCKSYVDLRVSDLCEQHRRQQKSCVGQDNNKKSSLTGKFHQLKQAHLSRQAPPVIIPSTPRNIAIRTKTTTSNRFLHATTAGMSHESVNVHQTQSMNQSQTATHPVNQPNSIGPLGKTVPMHMKKTESHTDLPTQRHKVQGGLLALQERQNNTNHSTAKRHLPTTHKYSTITGDWLQGTMSKQTVRCRAGGQPLSAYLKNSANGNNQNKRRRVNTDGAGFDGSVPVPKPSRIFRSIDTTAITKGGSALKRLLSLKENQEQLLQRQAELARLRMEGPSDSIHSHDTKKTNSIRPDQNQISCSPDAFLAALGDFDHNKVRNAKSRFANEIEAEEYAASRQKVVELEKLEERQQVKDKHKSKENDGKKLTKEWRCQSCGQSYSVLPKSCFRAGHQVHTVRSIRKERTKEESRTILHTKQSDDGGLQLGAGLEWSGQFAGNQYLR
jgi:minichromosome maintenance protein 10